MLADVIEDTNVASRQIYLEPPAIIDVEASGFGPQSYPIEIGVALEDGDKYCTLVEPAPDWTHWDAEAEALHRIPRDLLYKRGKPIAEVISELNRLLSGKTVYSDGWVVDQPWLIKLFHLGSMDPMFRTSPLEMILSEDQMFVWDDTKADLFRKYDNNRHRASFDAFIIQQTWLETRKAVMLAARPS